jgi:predicted ArsR family transcriptional regulator
MIEIEKNTLEAKILEILMEVYPITVQELIKELGISEKIVERGLKKLQAKGIISLDILPDKSYIRLQRRDFHFIGRRETQKKALKRKGTSKNTTDYEGIAYR